MKAVVVLYAAVAFASIAVLGQGQFVFNTHDPSAGSDVLFALCGEPSSDPNLFVEVLAGLDSSHLQPLVPLLALNRTGVGAGYTNPYRQMYSVPGMAAGSSAVVGYHAFLGSSLATALWSTPIWLAIDPVTLTEPPFLPNEVNLGVQTLRMLDCPEPSTWALSVFGLCALGGALGRGAILSTDLREARSGATSRHESY